MIYPITSDRYDCSALSTRTRGVPLSRNAPAALDCALKRCLLPRSSAASLLSGAITGYDQSFGPKRGLSCPTRLKPSRPCQNATCFWRHAAPRPRPRRNAVTIRDRLSKFSAMPGGSIVRMELASAQNGCFTGVDARVGAIENCGHKAGARAAAERNMWSHRPLRRRVILRLALIREST
jgi:hypothetical protein